MDHQQRQRRRTQQEWAEAFERFRRDEWLPWVRGETDRVPGSGTRRASAGRGGAGGRSER